MIGNLIVKRVEDTLNNEAKELNVDIDNLRLAITRKVNNQKMELQEKYE